MNQYEKTLQNTQLPLIAQALKLVANPVSPEQRQKILANPNFTVVEHPLLHEKLTRLRQTATNTKEFRELVHEISLINSLEATKNLDVKEAETETPICKTITMELAHDNLVIVPIMRAGLEMQEGLHDLIPTAKIWHIGLFRGPNSKPVSYYSKISADCEQKETFIVDPMLATGGSAAQAVSILKNYGCRKIHFICIIAAPEGVQFLLQRHPDVDITASALDLGLDANNYIVPGLGDAGDRIFGTK